MREHKSQHYLQNYSHCYSPSVKAHSPWGEFKHPTSQEWMYFGDFKCAPRYL